MSLSNLLRLEPCLSPTWAIQTTAPFLVCPAYTRIIHLWGACQNFLCNLSSKTSLCNDTCTSVNSQDQIQQLFMIFPRQRFLSLTIEWQGYRDLPTDDLGSMEPLEPKIIILHLMILSKRMLRSPEDDFSNPDFLWASTKLTGC
jgi:hypothetical protein